MSGGRKKSIRSWFRRNNVFLIIVLVAVVTIVSLSALISNISENRAYDRYMETARESILTGDYDGALSFLRKAASIDATDDCLLLMAQCYESQGNYDKAILALRSMSSISSAVTTKIASIETTKQQAESAGKVIIAGEAYDVSETSLALDNRGLGNDIMSEISRMYALSALSLAGNNISDVRTVSGLHGLTSLNLNGNQVSDISSLASLSGLRTLYLDDNPVTDFSPLFYLQSLTSLSIKGVDITQDELKALSAALPNCAINGAGAIGTTSDSTSQYIALGGMTFDSNVRELDLSYRGITDISALSNCTRLTTLNLSGNAVGDISPLMDIPSLSSLNISSNSVTDLRPLMGISSLKYLYASNNSIFSTVSLGSNTALTELDLSGNPVSDFSGIRKLKNLMKLDLSGTGMRPSDIQFFSYLSRLVSLNVENNPALTGEAVTQLKSMIPSCSVKHSGLVFSIEASGNTVDSNTTSIDMTGQGIEDLSFLSKLPNLQSARLAANNLTNIYSFQYTESWRTLTYLDLSSNYISDITPVSCLRNLVTLNLSDNLITNITPLYGMDSLRELYLGGNPLNDGQIRELNAYLPQCTIVFR